MRSTPTDRLIAKLEARRDAIDFAIAELQASQNNGHKPRRRADPVLQKAERVAAAASAPTAKGA